MGDIVSPELDLSQQNKDQKGIDKKADSHLGKINPAFKKIAGKVILGTPLAGLILSSGSVDNPNVPKPNIKEPTPAVSPLPGGMPSATIEFTDSRIAPIVPASPTPTPEPTPASSPTPTIEPTPRPTQVVKPPTPTIEATKAPTPKPKEEENKWTGREWAPNQTVPVREWWDDMVAKGYISIDDIAQQNAGKQIDDFLKGANLVPNPVKYYLQGHGFINNCNLEFDKLVSQGQGHIKITSNAYAQIPGGVKCQIFTKGK